MSSAVSWRNMASWGDLQAMAPHMLAGTWAKTAGVMQPRMSVAQTMGQQFPGCAQSPFLLQGFDQIVPLRGNGCGARDYISQAGCEAALDGQVKALVRFGR